MLRALLELLYPNTCALCRKPLEGESGVCRTCLERIPLFPWIYCIRCARRLVGGNPCPAHKYRTPVRGIGVVSNYNNERVRNIIWKYKYRGYRELAAPLSELAAKYAKQEFSNILVSEGALVIPIPLHEKRERARGFNQSALIAKKFASRLGLSIRGDVLKRTLDRRPQVTFKEESKRYENIRGAFSVATPDAVREKTVLLIDDVATTGATLEEAAGVLKRAGAKTVWALVIASPK